MTGSIKDRMALHILSRARAGGAPRARGPHRGGDQRQHRDRLCRHRPRAGPPGRRLHAGLDERGARGAAARPGRRRAPGEPRRRRVPGQHRAGGGVRGGSPRRVPAPAVLEPRERGRPRGDDGAGDLAPDARGGAVARRVRRRRGHGRDGDGRRALPAAGLPRGPHPSSRAGQLAHAVGGAQGRVAIASRGCRTSSCPRSWTSTSSTRSSAWTTATRSSWRSALARDLGLGVGISSGANFLGAVKVQDELGPDAEVVTVFPDDDKKYLSTDLLRDEPVAPGYLTPGIRLLGFDASPRL